MSKKFKNALVALIIPVMIFISGFSGAAPVNTVKAEDGTVLDAPSVSDESAVMEARFQHMLSLSTVFGEDFNSAVAMIGSAQQALVDYATEIDGFSYIHAALISSFIKNLYGKSVNATGFGDEMPAPEGYISMVAKGFSYTYHDIVSVTNNEDGTFTVVSGMHILSHDGQQSDALATSVFVKSESSSFGYNITYCEIL